MSMTIRLWCEAQELYYVVIKFFVLTVDAILQDLIFDGGNFTTCNEPACSGRLFVRESVPSVDRLFVCLNDDTLIFILS